MKQQDSYENAFDPCRHNIVHIKISTHKERTYSQSFHASCKQENMSIKAITLHSYFEISAVYEKTNKPCQHLLRLAGQLVPAHLILHARGRHSFWTFIRNHRRSVVSRIQRKPRCWTDGELLRCKHILTLEKNYSFLLLPTERKRRL